MAKNISSKFGVAEGFFTDYDKEKSSDKVKEVSLTELHTFKNHPFSVLEDEWMEELVESIKNQGVLVAGTVRPRKEGGYEIVSGHRRKRACEIAGLSTMPVVVKDMTDDEAIVTMVDSNIQREEVLPSEKAKAYKMKYEAMKHQGTKQEGTSLEEMSKKIGESRATIQRLISIADLNSDLLKLIDEKKMGLAQGVDLSYLSEEEQEIVSEVIADTSKIPTMVQSAEIKDAKKHGRIDAISVKNILIGKPTPAKRKITIKERKLQEYFPEEYSTEQIEDVIFGLLDEWKSKNI